MKRTLIFVLLFFLFSPHLFSQQSKLFKNVNEITEFIASDYFESLSKNINDLSLVDSVFVNAVRISNYDYSEALLSLTFAAVLYKKVPIKIPLIEVIVGYPLVSSGDSLFSLKNENLPSQLFWDSPQNEFGDKDKIAHFFGSAYLSYASHIFDLGDLIGYFVEVFEEKFKVQSEVDYRDIDTNKLGNLFGELLKKDKSVLPSHVLVTKFFHYNRIIP